MNPALIFAAIDGATAILAAALPELAKLAQSGTITPEDQQARLDKINTLRTDAAFTGPEWDPSGA